MRTNFYSEAHIPSSEHELAHPDIRKHGAHANKSAKDQDRRVSETRWANTCTRVISPYALPWCVSCERFLSF